MRGSWEDDIDAGISMLKSITEPIEKIKRSMTDSMKNIEIDDEVDERRIDNGIDEY